MESEERRRNGASRASPVARNASSVRPSGPAFVVENPTHVYFPAVAPPLAKAFGGLKIPAAATAATIPDAADRNRERRPSLPTAEESGDAW